MTMKKTMLLSALPCLCAAFAWPSFAQNAPVQPAPAAAPQSTTTSNTPAPATVTTSNDTNNYDTDRLSWTGAIEAYDAAGGNAIYCLPANTVVIGTKSSLDNDPMKQPAQSGGQNGSGTAGTTVTYQWQQVRLAEDAFPYFGDIQREPYLKQDSGNWYMDAPASGQAGAGTQNQATVSDQATQQCPDVKSPQRLFVGTYFDIRDDNLQKAHRSGWEYGALVIPFKLQLSQGKALSGSASLGPYLGFRIPFFDTGVIMSPVVFAGASTIAVPTASTGGQSSTQNLAGLSYGGGLVFSVKDNFQVGIILGADHVDSSANYTYNNKPWLSFEIGYSFAQ